MITLRTFATNVCITKLFFKFSDLSIYCLGFIACKSISLQHKKHCLLSTLKIALKLLENLFLIIDCKCTKYIKVLKEFAVIGEKYSKLLNTFYREF